MFTEEQKLINKLFKILEWNTDVNAGIIYKIRYCVKLASNVPKYKNKTIIVYTNKYTNNNKHVLQTKIRNKI